MKVMLLGPPGVGKGTQAEELSKCRGIPHISTGDIFREAQKKSTPLGLEAKKYIEKGLLVPDDIVVNIVVERLQKNDCKKGFLLDGFPRNLAQAKALDDTLSSMNTHLDVVFYLNAPEETIVRRSTGRRICRSCGNIYHIDYMPPKQEGICDNCGGELYQREDDKPETVLERLRVYNKQTVELVNYYRQSNILCEISADRDANEIFRNINEELDALGLRV